MNAADLNPAEELRRVFGNARDQLSTLGTQLLRAGDHREAGVALVGERMLYQLIATYVPMHPDQVEMVARKMRANGAEMGGREYNLARELVAQGASVPLEKCKIERCRHTFGADGKCTLCDAARKRAPRATTTPAGGTP